MDKYRWPEDHHRWKHNHEECIQHRFERLEFVVGALEDVVSRLIADVDEAVTAIGELRTEITNLGDTGTDVTALSAAADRLENALGGAQNTTAQVPDAVQADVETAAANPSTPDATVVVPTPEGMDTTGFTPTGVGQPDPQSGLDPTVVAGAQAAAEFTDALQTATGIAGDPLLPGTETDSAGNPVVGAPEGGVTPSPEEN